MNMTTSWWTFFEGKKVGDLRQSVIDFLDQLEDELQLLPEEMQKKEMARISHISANLFAYVALKEKQVTKKAPKLELQETYNIAELLAIIHRERELDSELISVREDIRDQDVQYRDLTKKVNNQFVAYLETPERSAERFQSALQVITLQTEQALINERLRLLKANQAILDTEFFEIQEAKNVAISRLTFTEEEQLALDERISNTTVRLQEANTKLLREQSQLLLLPDETAEDQAVARLRNQRVAKEKINVAILEARLDMYENERDILLLLSQEESVDIERIQKIYSERQRMLQDITLKAKDWFNQN